MPISPLLIFYILVLLLEWGGVALLVLLTGQPYLVGLITFTPGLAAVLAAALTGGRAGLRLLWRRVTLWRVWPLGYAAALGVPLLVNLGTAIAARLMGASLSFPLTQLPGLALVTLLLAAGEEIGWRGFALPRMVERFSPLATGLLFGILHGAFHLPMYLLPLPPELRQSSPFWLYTIMTVGFSIPGLWLFHRTRGSVAVAILYHTTINLSVLLLNGAPREMLAWLMPLAWILAAALMLALVGPRLEYEHYQPSGESAR